MPERQVVPTRVPVFARTRPAARERLYRRRKVPSWPAIGSAASSSGQSAECWIPASSLALGLAAIGETEAALDWLERSFREEGGDWTLRDPLWDPLRGEPRFQALWDQVGLPGAPPEG